MLAVITSVQTNESDLTVSYRVKETGCDHNVSVPIGSSDDEILKAVASCLQTCCDEEATQQKGVSRLVGKEVEV